MHDTVIHRLAAEVRTLRKWVDILEKFDTKLDAKLNTKSLPCSDVVFSGSLSHLEVQHTECRYPEVISLEALVDVSSYRICELIPRTLVIVCWTLRKPP